MVEWKAGTVTQIYCYRICFILNMGHFWGKKKKKTTKPFRENKLNKDCT